MQNKRHNFASSATLRRRDSCATLTPGAAESGVLLRSPIRTGKGWKPWFLYLIECEDKSIYTGIAVDVVARYAAHKNGTGARYTRSHPPRKLLAVVQYSCRSAASQAEYLVKQMTAREKRGFVVTVKGKKTARKQSPSVTPS